MLPSGPRRQDSLARKRPRLMCQMERFISAVFRQIRLTARSADASSRPHTFVDAVARSVCSEV